MQIPSQVFSTAELGHAPPDVRPRKRVDLLPPVPPASPIESRPTVSDLIAETSGFAELVKRLKDLFGNVWRRWTTEQEPPADPPGRDLDAAAETSSPNAGAEPSEEPALGRHLDVLA